MIYDLAVPTYNHSMVNIVIAKELERQGRGSQTRLAEHVGVRVQTVNKWVQGQTSPERFRFHAIEEFFGWKENALLGLHLQDHGFVGSDLIDENGNLIETAAYRALRQIADDEPTPPGGASMPPPDRDLAMAAAEYGLDPEAQAELIEFARFKKAVQSSRPAPEPET